MLGGVTSLIITGSPGASTPCWLRFDPERKLMYEFTALLLQIKHSRLHSNAVHSEFTWFNRQGSGGLLQAPGITGPDGSMPAAKRVLLIVGSTQDAVTQAFSLLSEYDQEYLHEQLKQEVSWLTTAPTAYHMSPGTSAKGITLSRLPCW